MNRHAYHAIMHQAWSSRLIHHGHEQYQVPLHVLDHQLCLEVILFRTYDASSFTVVRAAHGNVRSDKTTRATMRSSMVTQKAAKAERDGHGCPTILAPMGNTYESNEQRAKDSRGPQV